MQVLAYICGLWFQWQFSFQGFFPVLLVCLVYLVLLRLSVALDNATLREKKLFPRPGQARYQVLLGEGNPWLTVKRFLGEVLLWCDTPCQHPRHAHPSVVGELSGLAGSGVLYLDVCQWLLWYIVLVDGARLSWCYLQDSVLSRVRMNRPGLPFSKPVLPSFVAWNSQKMSWN